MTTSTPRRTEGRIEWRGRDTFRVRVHNGFDPATGQRRYLDATGRGNQKTAERALRELLAQRDGGLTAQPKRVTSGEWMTTWLEGRIADGAVGPRAATNYRVILKSRLLPAVGHLRLTDLRTNHVVDLKTSLISSGLAPATVAKMLGLLRGALEAALIGGLIARNPAAAVPSPSVASTSRERRALDEAEITLLLRAAAGTPFDFAVRLALATGCRQSELLGARWEHFDLERGTFFVSETLQHVDGGFQVLPPKTRNSRRLIELSQATVALLRRHRADQNEERLRLGPAWHDHGLVLAGPDGRPQYRRIFYRDFVKVAAQSGIESPETVNWHSLRHTAASLWLKAGVDVFTVSRRLGHGKASFTMDVYGHLLKGQQRAAAEALDHLLAAN